MKMIEKIKVTIVNDITIQVKDGNRTISIKKPKRLVKIEASDRKKGGKKIKNKQTNDFI
jgi:hypothetical protein